MEGLFVVLFLAVIVGFFGGGLALSIRWVKHWLARVFLGLLPTTVFIVTGTTAVIAGCTAVVGPPNFQ